MADCIKRPSLLLILLLSAGRTTLLVYLVRAMMHGWGFGQRFEEQYHCYSVAYVDKPHLGVSLLCWCNGVLLYCCDALL